MTNNSAAKKATKGKTSSVLKVLFSSVRGYWKDTIFTWIFVLVESVCEVLVVFFMQYLIDGDRKSVV